MRIVEFGSFLKPRKSMNTLLPNQNTEVQHDFISVFLLASNTCGAGVARKGSRRRLSEHCPCHISFLVFRSCCDDDDACSHWIERGRAVTIAVALWPLFSFNMVTQGVWICLSILNISIVFAISRCLKVCDSKQWFFQSKAQARTFVESYVMVGCEEAYLVNEFVSFTVQCKITSLKVKIDGISATR